MTALRFTTHLDKSAPGGPRRRLARLRDECFSEMPTRPSVLVTGGTGTVGRQVVAELLEAGAKVRAVTRNPEGIGLPDGVTVTRADLSDAQSLRAPLERVEAVFLLWPFATAEGTPEVINVVAENARRVVYLSSAAVRDHEHEVERLIVESGLEWTLLRPDVFAANTLRWAEEIRADGVVRGPYGDAAMAPIHERDIAAVAVLALIDDGHTGAVYELTGPELLTQTEQARIIGEVIDSPVRWVETPPETARQQMLARGWPPAAVDRVLHAQARMVTNPRPTTPTVQKVTGTPARSFRAWVMDHASDFAAS